MALILQQRFNAPPNLKQLRLRTLLVVPFVLLVMGSVGFVGYLSYRGGQDAVENLAHQLVDEAGDRVTLFIEKVTETPHLVNRINADAIRLGVIPGFDATDSTVLENYFLAQILQFPSVSTIAIANERGGMIGSARSEHPQTFYLYRTPNFTGGSYSASVVDALGTVLQDNVATTEPYDATTRPWYASPEQAGRATWSPIYTYAIGSGLDQAVLGISAGLPLYDRSGNLEGVLATDIVLDKFNQFLADLEVSPSSQVFIIERSGLLVASSTQPPLLAPGDDSERINAIECDDPMIQGAMMQLLGDADGLTSVEKTSFQFDQDGTQHHMRVREYKDAFGLDWLIVTVVPESDFMAQIHGNVRRTVGLCGLTLVGAIALSIWLARKISKPILALNEAAESFKNGKIPPRFPPTRIQEVESLHQSFSKMMTDINEANHLQQTYTETLEQQVEEKTKALNEAQHIARVGSWEWQLETNEVIWSRELYCIYEAEDQYPVANPYAEIQHIHPDDAESYQVSIHEMAIAHQPFDTEVRIITQRGNIRHVRAKGQPISNAQGDVVTFVGTVADITDYKSFEQALHQSEQRYRAIVNDQTELVCRFLPDGTLTFVNTAYCDYFECSESHLLGHSFLNLVPEAEQDAVRQFLHDFSTLTSDYPTVTHEHPVITADGETRWQQWTNRAIFDADGRLTEIQSVGRDITNRKHAEELLRRSEARYLAILEDQTELIKRFKPDYTHTFVNEAFCRYHGLSKEEVIGRPFANRVYPDDQVLVDQVMASLSPDHPVGVVEHRVIAKGVIRWMQWINRGVYDDQGNLVEIQAVGRDIHDRKQAELALEYNNHQLQAFLDNAPAAISQFGSNGKYSRVNAKFAGFLNMPGAQVVGKCFDDLFPAETAALFKTRIQKLLETKQALEVEDEIEVNGKRRTFRSILFPILPDLKPDRGPDRGPDLKPDRELDQEPQRFWAIASDITERKRIENALKEKTEELDRFFSVALDLLCIADTDGYFHRLNRQWEDTLGYSLDELEGSRFLDFVHPDDIRRTLDTLTALSQNRVVNDFVNRYRCRDGSYRWIEWRSVPVGRWMYAAARDITDRKNAEFYLKESEEKFATVFHSNPTPCWIATLEEGRILEVNEGFAHFYGASVTDLLDKTFADLHLWDDPRDYQKFQQILYATRRLPNFEVVLRKRSGEQRTVLMSASVNWINGQDCIVGVLNDISDRKYYETQVQHTLSEQETLLRDVHHRVKNNLQLVQLTLQMQQQRMDNLDAAQAMRESCNHIVAIGLVYDILYRSGTLTEIDLADYIPCLVQQITGASYLAGWPIPVNASAESVTVPPKTAICCGLILNELVTNALKYAFPDMREGQIDVTMTVSHDANPARVNLSVTDNGVGLPEDWTVSEQEPMGLTLVQNFVQELQGTLEVESNGGTRFAITFPVPGDRPNP